MILHLHTMIPLPTTYLLYWSYGHILDQLIAYLRKTVDCDEQEVRQFRSYFYSFHHDHMHLT